MAITWHFWDGNWYMLIPWPFQHMNIKVVAHEQIGYVLICIVTCASWNLCNKVRQEGNAESTSGAEGKTAAAWMKFGFCCWGKCGVLLSMLVGDSKDLHVILLSIPSLIVFHIWDDWSRLFRMDGWTGWNHHIETFKEVHLKKKTYGGHLKSLSETYVSVEGKCK